MPKSRLSEAIGVQRVRVGNKDKTEAWLVKGTSCKYVLVAVFIIVGCFVAAIVATQISFVSEKHKLVEEENAHHVMEVALEKKFLEVGSLLENELRRRLKHTKMSEALHAEVQGKLEDVDYPAQTLYQGDPELQDLISDVSHMASDVHGMINNYAEQMKTEAARSSKLLAALAKHLGGEETEELIKDTDAIAPGQKDLSKEELAAKVKEERSRSKGIGLKQRTKEQRERVARFQKEGATFSGSADAVLEDRREQIRSNMAGKGKPKPVMRKAKDLKEQRKPKAQAGDSKRAGNSASSASAGDQSGDSDFIQGRDLQSLLVRFFMRLNKIDSVVFPDKVKSEIASIQEKHQDKVAQIEAESSTQREKSQKLRSHWDSTLEELKTVLEEDGVAGVETQELNHASWLVDELLKEIMNVIDVQDLKETLFKLEDQFKSGEDDDAIAVMKQLQKMAREGDLPYEWVFGGSTGLSATGREREGNVHGMMGRPRGHRRQPGDPEDEGEEDDEEGDDEDYDEDDAGPGGPMGMMGGAPQYMWWRDYPRQVDNPHWKPPPGMMDNFEFLDREREETARRRKEELKHAGDRRHNLHGPDKDGDGIPDDEDDEDNREFVRDNMGLPPRRNHTRHGGGGGPGRKPPRGRRWGQFGRNSNNDNKKRSRNRQPMTPNRNNNPRRPGLPQNGDGDENDEDLDGVDDDEVPFGGFRIGKRQKPENPGNGNGKFNGGKAEGPGSRFKPNRNQPHGMRKGDDYSYSPFAEDDNGIPNGPPKDRHPGPPSGNGVGYDQQQHERHRKPFDGHDGAHQRDHAGLPNEPHDPHNPPHNPRNPDANRDGDYDSYEPRHKPPKHHRDRNDNNLDSGLDIREPRD